MPNPPTPQRRNKRSRKPASKWEEEERRGDFIDLTTPSLLSSLLFRLLPTLLFSSSSSCIYAGQKDRYLLLLLLSRSRAKKNSFSLRAVEGPFVTTPSSHPFFPPSPPQGPYLIEPLEKGGGGPATETILLRRARKMCRITKYSQFPPKNKVIRCPGLEFFR